ncbi:MULTISPECIES: hypothetical protein [unclassified Methylobacterium]|uniref:hypothetical protein n=1 Tax=unclassified Methylobacterium TaxID=2615210 RepID=UPI0009EC411B|nr:MULTISPECIES: hypothetical protein [unclassified Methylobacterium]USU30522.1 hypothetical protein NG677_14140 [Methylobacterium sp. OTU13CASTA1]
MSEPARQFPPNDQPGRPQPGPLRDWLAAMKAVTATQAAQASRPAGMPQPVEEVAEPQAEAPAWTPRVVAPSAATPAPLVDSETDLSDLMAENLMLKAKLKVEFERYDSLQAVLADELRGLRGHVESEMQALDEVRAERDQLKALTAAAASEMREMRTKINANAEELAQARSERDLWMARAETLAQPLFQRR